jgi:Bifunctional DNA primase/polymerase, N-terminal
MGVLAAALAVALEEHLLVFPCHLDKRPATPNGLYDATDDPARIRRWDWRDRLVGVPTGGATGVIVLDIDKRGAAWGHAHLKWLCGTRAHVTRSGMLHFLWRDPGHDVTCSAGRGVDVRGEGGYIVWWPCHGFDTVNYDLDPLIWPTWLDEANAPPPVPKRPILTAASKVHRGNLIGLCEFVEGAKNGERNRALFWAACRMGDLAAAGLTEANAIAMLVTSAAQVGLDPYEAEKTARSGFRRTSSL